jgi:hypothetical protein
VLSRSFAQMHQGMLVSACYHSDLVDVQNINMFKQPALISELMVDIRSPEVTEPE